MGRRTIGLLVLVGVSSTGCQALLTSSVTRAPNEYKLYQCYRNFTQPTIRKNDIDAEFFVETPSPPCLIWCGVLEPDMMASGPRPTVLLLHGVFGSCSTSPNKAMFQLGTRVASSGYRVVLVDLRGHGRSTGRFITHGIQESQDMTRVIDVLTLQGKASGPIGVLGYSHGAATALHLAAKDERIEAVVALAAPVALHDSLPRFANTVFPVTRKLYSSQDFQQAINVAARRRGFDPEEADTTLKIQSMRAPVLLVYAADDAVAPPDYGVQLRNAAPDHSELAILPGDGGRPDVEGHLNIIQDETAQVSDLAAYWFGEHL